MGDHQGVERMIDPVTPQPSVEKNAGERLKRFECLETVDWKSVADLIERKRSER